MTDSGPDLPPVRYVRSADGVALVVGPCRVGRAAFTLPAPEPGAPERACAALSGDRPLNPVQPPGQPHAALGGAEAAGEGDRMVEVQVRMPSSLYRRAFADAADRGESVEAWFAAEARAALDAETDQ